MLETRQFQRERGQRTVEESAEPEQEHAGGGGCRRGGGEAKCQMD